MGYDMYGARSKNYFRANIWGMGEIRQLLDKAGALSHEDSPRFPDDKDFKTDESYREACDAIRKGEPPEHPQAVPLYKFCSNDGWVVWPNEALFIAQKLFNYLLKNRKKFSEEDYNYYMKFVTYNSEQAEAGEEYEVW